MNKGGRLRKEIVRLLEAGITSHVFPGAAAAVAYRENDEPVIAFASAGTLDYANGERVLDATLYDLASLTKPVTAMTAMRLVEAEMLSLDGSCEALLSDLRGIELSSLNLRGLLSHRGGVDAWGGLYLDVPHEAGSGAARRWILAEAARRVHPTTPPRCEYSDLGYVIAGEVVARANKTTLDAAVREWLSGPLGLGDELFYAGEASRSSRLRKAAPTERCPWRGRIIRGEVHDENCAALGGVGGHAGLFASAETVASFGRAMLEVYHGRSNFLRGATHRECLADPCDGGRDRIGWDTKGPRSSAGQRMSARAFGHLGFTGTSLWCDPERDVAVVLLTNRVHPSRANEKIRGFRPAFHDGVLAVYDRE
ncbi:MAG: serine hydrolase domain-containing protein [Myxococcota bacterium]